MAERKVNPPSLIFIYFNTAARTPGLHWNYEFTNELSFIPWGEPARDEFVYYSVLSVSKKRVSIPCQRFDFYQRVRYRRYAFLASSCLAMDYSTTIRRRVNVLREPLPSNDHIRHSYNVYSPAQRSHPAVCA
jgi:hypothetical protein